MSERSFAQDAEHIQIGEARMKISRDRRAKKNNGFEVRFGRLTTALHKFRDLVFRNHVHPQFLPTAAGAAATRTASPEAAESAATTAPTTTESSKTASAAPSATPAAAEDVREKNPEKQGA